MRALALSLLSIFAIAPALRAHDTWLSPDHFVAAKAGRTTLSLSSGMEFPTLDHAIAADRVASATWRSSRGNGTLPRGTPAANALTFSAAAPKGTALYAVSLHPRPSSLKRAQVREYIDHLGIPDAAAVFSAWEQRPPAEETPYRYMKYAKTIVRRGAPSPSRVWAEPVGMRLEIVPLEDPTTILAGGSIEVLVLDGGKPLAHYPVSMIRSDTAPIPAVTGADGKVRLPVSAAGPHMIRATKLESSAEKNVVWDVHFATFTFASAKAR